MVISLKVAPGRWALRRNPRQDRCRGKACFWVGLGAPFTRQASVSPVLAARSG